MIIVRKTSRTVFSSSWTRREQAERLDEWQIMARKATNCGQSTRHRYLMYQVYKEFQNTYSAAEHKMNGRSNEIIALLVWSK